MNEPLSKEAIEFVDRINKLWERSEGLKLDWMRSVVDVGQALSDAKARLKHGEWGQVFSSGRIRFSQTTASKYMRAAELIGTLSNSQCVVNLPTDASTISLLSSLKPDRIIEALSNGSVTAKSNREEVRAFVNETKGRTFTKLHKKPKPLYTLYVIESEVNRVKVGISLNHVERWDSLERSGGFRVRRSYLTEPLPFAKEVESLLKAVFRDQHLRGEWFAADFEHVSQMASEIVEVTQSLRNAKAAAN